MKVKQIKQRGELVWLVDGKINGKRKRMFFAPERQPERWLKTEEEEAPKGATNVVAQSDDWDTSKNATWSSNKRSAGSTWSWDSWGDKKQTAQYNVLGEW